MPKLIQANDARYGFWVMTGFLAALLVWHLASQRIPVLKGATQ